MEDGGEAVADEGEGAEAGDGVGGGVGVGGLVLGGGCGGGILGCLVGVAGWDGEAFGDELGDVFA